MSKIAFQKKYARACLELDAYVATLSPADLAGPVDAAGWTIKDHIAHLADWQAGISALLRKKDRWAAMGYRPGQNAPDISFDELNAALHARHTGKSAAQVLAYFKRTRKRFDAVFSTLSSADLKRPYAWYDPAKRFVRDPSLPVSEWLDGDTWAHYPEHIGWMKQILVDDRARRIALYGSGPDLLDAALTAVPTEMWQFKPSKKDWSVHEILVHIADSESNSALRVRKALAEPGGAIMGYDQDVWAKTLDYHKQSTDDARAITRLARATTHALIKELPATAWSLTYYHPENKAQISLDRWLSNYAVHIPNHITQIQQNVAIWRKRKSS